MAPEETHRIEVGVEELEEILREAKAGTLSEESYAKLEKILASFAYMTDLISEKGTTIARLRHLLFGPRSERSRDLLAKLEEPETKDAAAATGEGASGAGGPNPDDAGAADDDGAGATGDDDSEPAPSGHGRNGAEDYTGAERREVKLEGLKAGDPCPVENCKGRLYRQKPGVLVRVKGQAPLLAIIWALEKLRCGLCGKVFTARAPEGLGEEKYDESARAMLALLKYGTGLPLNRLEKLEGNLGIPLPSSSQWEVLEDLADEVEPVFRDLVREAAQGEVLHNDDTPMKILSLEPPGEARSRAPPGEEGDDERTGLFTSGIVSRVKDHQVALYFTGRKHAGENLADVLKRRAEELGPPIQMCDALSRNVLEEGQTQLGNCLSHGRRKFVELLELFPAACRTILEELRKVYRTDARARKDSLSKEARLKLHQEESGPVMESLEGWLEGQLSERKVEPNSGLGQAIQYMLRHWKKLTLFLRVAGAPLDNNICERSLKKAILHRNNSLFYKSENGARVGDIFMSVIQTCELEHVNPFEYLLELQRHIDLVGASPGEWLPWRYRETLGRLGAEAHNVTPKPAR